MEKLQPCKINLILLVQFCSLVLPSSGYTPAVSYFINCGSETSATLGPQRTFVPDFPYFVRSGKPVKDSNSSASIPLYQTARVFHKEISSYQFEIDRQGTYIVRLHFSVFSSQDIELGNAVFDVRASGFALLSGFNTSKINSSVVKEFLLTINPGKFVIFFMPLGESSLAFVNAIEVFLAPERFIPNNTARITSAGRKGNHSGLLSQTLYIIHRINVGGSKLTAGSDTLWRNWIEDDDFLSYPETAKDLSPFGGSLRRRQQITEEIAPDFVYKTAKELKQNFSNITWGFKVSKNSRHLVRVHFCDITDAGLGNIIFNLNIYSNFSKKINPFEETGENASPFYFDFVVDSDNSGFMNISVHQRNDSIIKNAFLNGLEIMEIMEKTGLDPKPHKKKNSRPFMVCSAGAVLFLLVSVVALLAILKSRRSKSHRLSGRPFSMNLFGGSSHSLSFPPDLNLELKMPYAEIQCATKNFNSKMLIGEGGFGKVYKGTLGQGVKVAVKRSEPGNDQGFLEFQTEIMVLSQIRHRHLVSLIGYCDERSEMILVYEFMEKGTLREHLYTSDSNSEKYASTSELSWEQRLKICIDAAKGLHYLHTGLDRRIIHRDVKSTNILLSEDYTAKVADFGLSKSGAIDPDANTHAKGSVGYFDPEYFLTSRLTEKSDVYSFGVVLVEVLCARPAIFISDRGEKVNLAEWGMRWQREGKLEKIIDPALDGTIYSSSLRKFGETAEKCLRRNSEERPTMDDVRYDLELALAFQQSSMRRELDDKSVTSSSLELALQAVNRLPSQRPAIKEGEDDSYTGGDDGLFTMASGVFSQLRIDGGR